MYYHGFDSLEKGPAAMTLEEELREQLTEASVSEVAPRENPPQGSSATKKLHREPSLWLESVSVERRDVSGTSWLPMYSPADANIIPEIHQLWTAKRLRITNTSTTWTRFDSKGACSMSMPYLVASLTSEVSARAFGCMG